MITINELLKIANQRHHHKVVTLPLALHTWICEEGICPELIDYLEPCGLSVEKAKAAIELCLNNHSPLDEILITKALNFGLAGKPYAAALLKFMCESPHYPLTKDWVNKGLDVSSLLLILNNLKSEPSILEKMTDRLNADHPQLNQFGENLTEKARAGKFGNLFTRKTDLDQLIMVLMKTQKGHAIITGPAGVGKTCLVEQLAIAIETDEVPDPLKGMEIFQVSMSKLVAGTIYRGQFEDRLEHLLSELRSDNPVILFIDEFHLIWGAGRTSESSMDASNILKPYLARDEFHMIGATTSEEFHRFITQDRALVRRFEEIPLQPPDGEILRQLVATACQNITKKTGYEIEESLIDLAIKLSNQYLPTRFQPDKSIDLLDLAVSKAILDKDIEINEETLFTILSKRTGVTFSRPGAIQRENIYGLENKLKKHLIGQDEAINKVTNTLIYRREMPSSMTERNLGTFLFSGPTGVGKTELGRLLASEYFGSKDHLLHIDLAEYTHAADISRLIGAAPGLIGHDNPGIMTTFMRERVNGVILFDEVEKADKEVQDFLLGILDNGRFRTGKGELISTTGSIIVVTTNALKQNDLQKNGVGFVPSVETKSAHSMLKQFFSPEFLARFDELILFRTLSKKDLHMILEKKIAEAVILFSSNQLSVSFDHEELIDFILSMVQEDGARGIQRALEKHFIQPIFSRHLHTWSANAIAERSI